MSNAKRSIDCQIDGILSTLGIKVERLNFPAKLKIVQELGIVAPSIIGRVNKRRNYLEHEYRLPTEDEVMDAIDIAQLFIEVSERSLQEFEHVIILGAPKDKSDADGRFWHCLHLSFDEDQKQYDVRGYSDGSHIGTGHLLSNTPEYVAALKLSLSAWDFALDRRKLKKPNKLLTPLRVFAEII